MPYFYFCLIVLINNIFIFANDIQYVSNITVTGNLSINDDEIKSKLKLKEPKILSRTLFTLKKLNKDKIILESFYKSKGFMEIDINVKYSSLNEKYIDIQYFINEGSQFSLKKLDINGNKIFLKEHILSFFNISSNNIYSPMEIRKGLRSLKQKYLEKGKVDIVIMDEVRIEGSNVNVRINIYEGPTYNIRRINIDGLEKVNKKYVIRELTFIKGDIFNINEMNISKDRIFNTRLFSSVEIRHSKIEGNEKDLDIIIKLREYRSSSIQANLGFKQLESSQSNISVTGLDTEAKWSIGNVLNTSSNIDLEARIATEINSEIFRESPLIERDISMTYHSPWTFFLRVPSRLRLFHEEESKDDDVQKNGITYSLWFIKNIDTKYEINSTIEFIQSSVPAINNDEERYVEIKYISNKINKPLSPKGGYYFSIESSLYGIIFGGENNFFKINTEYRKYVPFINKNIIAVRFVNGYINKINSDDILHKGYKFQLGGHMTLRGWSRPEYTDNPNGALISNMCNIEYRIPLLNKWGTYLFYDCAKLYDKIHSISSAKLIWNYGFGFIYNTRLGPIRLDIGFPYGDISNEQIHASLLYMF